jgi:hypothetical protein
MNARNSIRDNLEPLSNRTEESDSHSEKHPISKTSTDEGIMISIKPVPKNAHFSIRDNLDSDSNRTEKSDLHSEKHDAPKNTTELGIVRNLTAVF